MKREFFPPSYINWATPPTRPRIPNLDTGGKNSALVDLLLDLLDWLASYSPAPTCWSPARQPNSWARVFLPRSLHPWPAPLDSGMSTAARELPLARRSGMGVHPATGGASAPAGPSFPVPVPPRHWRDSRGQCRPVCHRPVRFPAASLP
jgi:hypothetical protein